MKTTQKSLSKRKLILYYSLLAFALLAIAGTATAVVLVTKSHRSSIDITASDNPPADSDASTSGTGDTTDNPVEDTTTPTTPTVDPAPTTSTNEWILPIATGVVSTGYTFNYNSTVKQYTLHTGLDITADAGTDVLAVRDGKVTGIFTGDLLEGNYITVSHADGLTTTYSFIDTADGLKVGDTVKQGDVLGTVSQATGNERYQGDHLHFTIAKDGTIVDPEPYLDIDLK